jgi:hypothetical protein
VHRGALFAGLITGAVGYFNYRLYIQKDFLRSEGHYRFSQRVANMTPWKQQYFMWWRMPEQEFEVYHKFKPYFIVGQVDYTKEVLLPRQRRVDGTLVDGYDVINPVYCYEGGRFSFKDAFAKKDPVSIERAALVVNRGWIPAQYKDKRSRPQEINTRKLVKIRGVFRRGKDIHDYKYPNNPDNNEWHNLCVEDIGIFWRLPNYDEMKHYYFEAVDIPGQADTTEEQASTYPIPKSIDELIEDHYGWKLNQNLHLWAFRGFGSLAALSLGVAFMA